MMTKPSNAAPQRPAIKGAAGKAPGATRPPSKTPVTKEAVQRVQSRTADKNSGQQGDWTRRLQSTLDKQAEPAAGGTGQHGGKGSGQKKSA
jgi:hypothetical protein